MQPNRLALFYNDEFTREDFKNFQLAVLDEMVLEDCYNNNSENGKALNQTKKLITQSYRRLEEVFGKPEKPKVDDPR